MTDWIASHLVQPLHRSGVAGRRVTQIAKHLAALVPKHTALAGIDVGCGNGELAAQVMAITPNLTLSGVDVLVNPGAVIPVTKFDGTTLPFDDKSFDFAMISDVLHHTDDPSAVLTECARVARSFVLVKDHICDSSWDKARLSLMDWVGNRAQGVYLPYNFLSTPEWQRVISIAGLALDERETRLALYRQPLSLLFDSTLHFVARYRL